MENEGAAGHTHRIEYQALALAAYYFHFLSTKFIAPRPIEHRSMRTRSDTFILVIVTIFSSVR